MKKCKYYNTRPTIEYTYNQLTGSPVAHDVEVGVCNGTKNAERCKCEGNEIKCDFYPEVRKQAWDNHWVVTEQGCVITCPKCSERLELCYPDGTEVTYLPYCPWCGKSLKKKEA